MSDSKEVKWLREYAKKAGYTIDEEMTAQFKEALSDTKINLRVPTALKEEIVKIANKKIFRIKDILKVFSLMLSLETKQVNSI